MLNWLVADWFVFANTWQIIPFAFTVAQLLQWSWRWPRPNEVSVLGLALFSVTNGFFIIFVYSLHACWFHYLVTKD